MFEFIFQLEHLWGYFRLFGLMAIISIGGVVMIGNLFPIPNKLIKIGGGMIWGVIIWVLLFNLTGYLFKGSANMVVGTSLFSFLTFWAITRKRKFKFVFYRLSFTKVLAISLIILIWVFIAWYGKGVVGGSSIPKYWSMSLSYARGNFPTRIPWQPDKLTVYHHAPFVLMGSIQAITGVNISIVHQFTSLFGITSLLLLGWGIGWSKGAKLLSIGLVSTWLIVVGGPVIWLGGTTLIEYADFVNWLGAGINNLFSMIYANYHLLAFGGLWLWLYIWSSYGKELKLKIYIALIIIGVYILSCEEILAVPLAFLAPVWFAKSLLDGNKITFEFIKKVGILICVTIGLFLLVQNTFRDALLTPVSNNQVRYKLVSSIELAQRWNIFTTSRSQSGWLLPAVPLLTLFTLLYVIKRKSVLVVSLIACSLVMSVGYLVVSQPGFVDNPTRLLNYAYTFQFLALTITAMESWSNGNGNGNGKRKKILSVSLVILIIPQTVTSIGKLLKEREAGSLNMYTYAFDYQNPTLQWIKNHTPFDARIVFVDEYPEGKSELSSDGLAYYGLFVVNTPQKVKLDLPEVGREWFDVVTTLSPEIIEELKVDYIFIKHSAIDKIPQFIKGADEVYSNSEGKFYKINGPVIVDQKLTTLTDIINSIAQGSDVFVDQFKFKDIRKILLLELQGKVNFFGHNCFTQNEYYIVAEAPQPKVVETDWQDIPDNIRYILSFPDSLRDMEFSNKYNLKMQSKYLNLWERVDIETNI